LNVFFFFVDKIFCISIAFLKIENRFLPPTKAGRGGGDLPPPHCQALRAGETCSPRIESGASRRLLVSPGRFCWAGETIFRPVLFVWVGGQNLLKTSEALPYFKLSGELTLFEHPLPFMHNILK
jgi:hypothetical protein